MKPSSVLSALAAVLLLGGTSARADLNDLIFYADQLLSQGVAGPRFVQLVDQRYVQMYPAGDPGMGAFVQEMHARGLRGRALADAIHAEQRFRGIPYGYDKPLPPGQVKRLEQGKPLPPGQAKKLGLPSPGAKFNGPPGLKPKDKAAMSGGGHGNGHGKSKKK